MIFNALVRRNINNNNSSSLLHVWRKKTHDYYYHVNYFSTTRTKEKQQKPINNILKVTDFLMHKHKFSPEVASYVASAVANTFKNPEKCDSVLCFLKDTGFTKSQLEKVLKSRPGLLLSSPEKIIKPKIKILLDFGFSSNDIADMISKSPVILGASAQNRIVPSLNSLKGLLGSTAAVATAVKRSGWLLIVDLDKTMFPNIEFLMSSCGMTMEQIMLILAYRPRFLLYRPELMRECVETVNGMGVDKSSKAYIYAVWVVGSMTKGKWDVKLQAFRNILGYSDDEILRVVKNTPQVFKASEDKMKKVKDIVLATGKYEASCIIKCPNLVMFSIEKRLKPRFQVLEILESRGLITKWPSLGTISNLSNSKFFEQFVRPYLKDIGDVPLQSQRVITSCRG